MADYLEELRAELEAAEAYEEQRDKLTAKARKALDDSDFAYIDKDGDRHLPVHDEGHVKSALGRFNQTQFDTDDEKKSAAKKIISKAKDLGIDVDPTSAVGQAAGLKAPETKSSDPDDENRNDATDNAETKECPTCDGKGTIMKGNRKCPTCKGSGTVSADYEKKGDTLLIEVATYIDGFTGETLFRDVNHEPNWRQAPGTAEEREEVREEERQIRDLRKELSQLTPTERSIHIDALPNVEELRDVIESFNDLQRNVEDALQSKLGDNDGDCDLWVNDVGQNADGSYWAVFNSYVNPPGMGLFRVGFTHDTDGAGGEHNDTITFTSNPVPVARVTTYESIAAPKPDLTGAVVGRSAADLDLEIASLEVRKASPRKRN
jgi:hypothetical protein